MGNSGLMGVSFPSLLLCGSGWDFWFCLVIVLHYFRSHSDNKILFFISLFPSSFDNVLIRDGHPFLPILHSLNAFYAILLLLLVYISHILVVSFGANLFAISIVQNNILKIRKVYDAFLAEFPLCYGYWKKYADHEANLGSIDKVVEVYERAVQGVTYSVDIWLHYCIFAIGTYGGDPDTVRRYNLFAYSLLLLVLHWEFMIT